MKNRRLNKKGKLQIQWRIRAFWGVLFLNWALKLLDDNLLTSVVDGTVRAMGEFAEHQTGPIAELLDEVTKAENRKSDGIFPSMNLKDLTVH